MNLPTLTETNELLTACIQSCHSQPQLATCREMMDSYITKRYKHYATPMEIAIVLDELDKLIEDQRAVIVETKLKAEYGIQD